MRKAMFVSYGGGHINMVLPVALEIRSRKNLEVHALGLTMAKSAFESAGIRALGFRDLLGPEDGPALRHGERLAAEHHQDGVGVTREESVAYLGLSYADLEQRVGTGEAEKRLKENGRQAFLPMGPVARAFDRVNPDVVIATDSPRAEQAAFYVARQRGIKSVCMTSLFGLEWGTPYLREPGYATRLAVMSEWVREYLVSLGRRPEEVVVTGGPAFDKLGAPDLPVRGAELRAKKGWNDRKVILWASQPQPAQEVPPQIMALLLTLVEKHPDWHVVYRPHPSEVPLPVPRHSRLSFSPRTDELAVLLHAIDAAIVMTTTVGMEAALSGKPLVKVTMTPFDYAAPYEKMDLALPVNRIEELEPRLLQALSDSPEARRMAAARKTWFRPGGAAGRVADVVESLVR